MEVTRDDIREATKYFNTYMTLLSKLEFAEIEPGDVDDYVDFKEKQLTKTQKEIFEIMKATSYEQLKD
jgi:beta-mannanase